MEGDGWWEEIVASDLRQGDLFFGVGVYMVDEPPPTADAAEVPAAEVEYDLVLMTQCCDLANKDKINSLVACPVYKLPEFSTDRPDYAKNVSPDEIRQGKAIGLHMLAALSGVGKWPAPPELNRAA